VFNMLIVIVASGLLHHRVLCWVVASTLLALLCSVQVLAQTSSVERCALCDVYKINRSVIVHSCTEQVLRYLANMFLAFMLA